MKSAINALPLSPLELNGSRTPFCFLFFYKKKVLKKLFFS